MRKETGMIKTVIVEDDRMVASINNQFAAKTPGIQVIATFYNGKNALEFLEKTKVDLLLLDLYMPEFSGLELLEALRRQNNEADVIMITAANDAPHIKEALRLGIVDYLIKPFRYERFAQAMDKYLLKRTVMETGMEFTQEDIDQLISVRRPSPQSREMELQKGVQRQTLNRIHFCLQSYQGEYLTSEQISAETGLSKVTVRRYMNYLIENNEVRSRVDYSTGGRPRVEYSSNSYED
ncbi:response regulator [Lacrimispora sp. JR3]|uniref:response regulator n=1 Tax=Lacrimispora sinapis TaxID=3111456 RepID=UPI0037488F1D